ncbi:MAG: hypothetical protein LBK63_00615 [Treponema sp.]|jgi:hypothetical protein|nr:hypothetical protein [Treponema sp.]
MYNAKAPAAALGLFLCLHVFQFSAFAQELTLSGKAGSLWVEEDGAAWFWGSGISYKTKEGLYVDLGLGQIPSNLPWLDGSFFGLRYSMGLDRAPLGFHFGGGLLRHGYTEVLFEDIPLYSEGGQGYCFSFSLPFYIHRLKIEASYAVGSGSWEDGSFYWFFGKPRVSAVHIPGLSLTYDQQYTLGFHRISLDLAIRNNDDMPLFDSGLAGYVLFAAFSRERGPFRLAGSLGWVYAGGSLEGALTASNQRYSLFPYTFYNVKGTLDAHIGYGAADIQYRHAVFQYRIALGVLQGFGGKAAADMHYKKKNLFGSSEAHETTTPLELEGLGAAFLLFNWGAPALRVGRGVCLSFDLNKTWVIPWGYQQNAGTSSGGGVSTGQILGVLLSGLSLHITLAR